MAIMMYNNKYTVTLNKAFNEAIVQVVKSSSFPISPISFYQAVIIRRYNGYYKCIVNVQVQLESHYIIGHYCFKLRRGN